MQPAVRAGDGDRGGRMAMALVSLLAVAMLLNFVDRGAIGIAAPRMKQELGLSATAFGFAASAFFWTYGLLQPLLGWMGDRFPVYRVLAFGLALWAVSTMLTGLVEGLAVLVMLRLILGVGESFVFPCTSKIIALHVPAERRGIANAVVAVGLALGPAVGTLAGGAILAAMGWRPVFVLFGAITLAWLLPWWLVVRALPKGATRADRPADPPYSALLRHKALWLAGVCHAATNYSFFFVSIWLPLYLVNTRGFSIGSMTVLVAAVFAVQAASSLVVGQLADRLVRAGHTQDVVLRRLSAGGLVAVTAGIAGVALAPGQAALAGWLLFTGVALGIGPVTVFAMGQTFAGPRLSGSWIGWQSAIGSLSGAVGPVVTGAIVDATGGYAGAFAFAGAVSLLGAGLFLWVLPTIRPVLAD